MEFEPVVFAVHRHDFEGKTLAERLAFFNARIAESNPAPSVAEVKAAMDFVFEPDELSDILFDNNNPLCVRQAAQEWAQSGENI